MSRALGIGLLLLAAAGCQLPPERASVRLLPEDTPPLPYAELLTRARQQITASTEAFQLNRWEDLEEAARGLEQTGRFFLKAIDVPAKYKDNLPVKAGDLGKEATLLVGAGKAKDVKQANEILQRISLKVRELRLED
jgi:hypothetical protein